MSESIRQSNLFAAEDYQKVFKAFSFIDYTAYDFDTLKQALINYIQAYYPEDFNDYIESSEFIAIIELLAYFGTSLAFRTDLNSRENFIDTAERRESIIRLAQMVNYVPRRNIPASGLFKISAIETNQPLTDANGININDVTIFWNDPNNPDWFDQFIQISNAAFSTLNPFGRPTKSGTIGSIPTDLYQLANVTGLTVTYPISLSINGQQYPVDICNPNFVTNQTIFERDPNPANAFNFIYRNDSLGVGSPNTGFFLYFKQGTLLNLDTNFEFPVPNRVTPIDIQNINQDDVYVQETDQGGNVINEWVRVPALAGENIIYNSIQFGERNIFDVISGANDTVSIRFADGNFGNVPTGLFRFWVRSSANQPLVIRPSDAQGLQINIPYIGSDQQRYILRVLFALEQTIGNAAASETDEQIRLRAPEVFSTQSRMVNNSDYNVLPLIYGNQIAKIQAINRTYSGQSRYIDLTDPTGFHRDLIIFGQDGALFRDNQNILVEIVEDGSNSGNIESILVNTIQTMLQDPKIAAFFYDEYIPQFEQTIRVNSSQSPTTNGYSLLDLSNPNQDPLYWVTSPAIFKNDTGYFSQTIGGSAEALINTFSTNNIPSGTYQSYGFIQSSSVIELGNLTDPLTINPVSVNSVVQNGLQLVINPENNFSIIGPVELALEEQTGFQVAKVYPAFRKTLNSTEVARIVAAIDNGISFWLYYDILGQVDDIHGTGDNWGVSTATTPGLSNQIDQPFKYAPAIVSGTPLYTSSPGATISGTVITVESTDGLVVGSYVQVRSDTTGLFENGVEVTLINSPTSFTVSAAPIQPFDATTIIIAGPNMQIYSDWPPYPAGGLLYVAIATSNETNNTTYELTARGRVYVFESYRDVRFYWSPNQIVIDNATGQALQDTIEIMPFVNTNSSIDNNEPDITDPSTAFLQKKVEFNLTGVFIQNDGWQDDSKVEVSLIDENSDGIPDDPNAFDRVVASNDRIVFEYFNNEVSGYQSTRPWITNWSTILENEASHDLYVYFPVDPLNPTVLYSSPYIANQQITLQSEILDPSRRTTPGFLYTYMDDAGLVFINNIPQLTFDSVNYNITIANQVTAFFNGPTHDDLINYAWLSGTENVINKIDIVTQFFINKSYLISSISPPGYGVFYTFEYQSTLNLSRFPTGIVVSELVDKYHYDRNGKVFTQNTTIPELNRLPLYFKWNHYSPIDQRVDPSPSNIIDMIVITDSFYRDMIIWKNNNGSRLTIPAAPTTEELRIQFDNLNQYKMVSDAIIWNSGEFKILFGTQAELELQATFKVVKSPSTNISNNEIKTQVITAIDQYFDIRNWDFGEKFFYTELAAYIHQQLSRIISSVVIVPDNANSQFGNLFEIVAGPTQLFMSTATVNNVTIVSNLTDQNLRV